MFAALAAGEPPRYQRWRRTAHLDRECCEYGARQQMPESVSLPRSIGMADRAPRAALDVRDQRRNTQAGPPAIDGGTPVESARRQSEAGASDDPARYQDVPRVLGSAVPWARRHSERLLRHVLGLERLPSWAEAVTAAFDGFVARHTTLTELQLRFLSTLKTFVLQNRRVERKDLVEAPFTQLHPRGVRGVFTGADLDEVVALAEGLVA